MKPTDKMYEAIVDEATRMWGEKSSMRDWYIKHIKRACMINDTQFLAFSNPHLITEFLFGYSDLGQGPSYDENRETMKNVRNQIISYFIEKNTEQFTRMIVDLRDKNNKFFKIIHHFKGVNEVYIQEVNYWNENEKHDYLTDAEREIAIKAYENELEKMTKRCHTWLKRYGTEKISLSSYWMDR